MTHSESRHGYLDDIVCAPTLQPSMEPMNVTLPSWKRAVVTVEVVDPDLAGDSAFIEITTYLPPRVLSQPNALVNTTQP